MGVFMLQESIMSAMSFVVVGFLSACGGGGGASSQPAQVVSSSSVQSSHKVPASSSWGASSITQSSQDTSSLGAAVRVAASGNYLVNAAPVFHDAWGGVAVEDQSCRDASSSRIAEVFDTTLQKYVFRFHMAMDDVDCATNESGRQRLEIKVYNLSPDNLKGVQGETHFYRWKVFLPDGFQVSTSFTHLFQIKPVGGDDALPLISLTARKANPNRLEILYAARNEAQRIAEIPLAQTLGKWLDVQVSANYAVNGRFAITIHEISSNTQLLHSVNNNLDMWRVGTEFHRPKWGIYRSLNNQQDLKEETLFYDDFCISEVENACW